MKGRWVVLSIVIVGMLSSALTVLLLKPDALFDRQNFDSRWGSVTSAPPQPAAFPALQVIDDTRNVLTFEQQKALFAGLSDRLRDPASTQLRLLRRSTKNKLQICGELNAKNGFGAYVGFAPFMGAIVGDRAVLVLLDREVVINMPAEVAAQLAKFGCSEAAKPAPRAAVQADATSDAPRQPSPEIASEPEPAPGTPKNILGTIRQLTGAVSLSNFKQFESFIEDNRDNIVGLKLLFKRSASESDILQVYKAEGLSAYVRENQTSEVEIIGNHRYENGLYHVEGFYLVKMAFFAQGVASYRLEPVDKSQMQFAKGIESSSLAN